MLQWPGNEKIEQVVVKMIHHRIAAVRCMLRSSYQHPNGIGQQRGHKGERHQKRSTHCTSELWDSSRIAKGDTHESSQTDDRSVREHLLWDEGLSHDQQSGRGAEP